MSWCETGTRARTRVIANGAGGWTGVREKEVATVATQRNARRRIKPGLQHASNHERDAWANQADYETAGANPATNTKWRWYDR